MIFVREPDAEPIPGYRLIEPIGSGGFGEVWKCEAPGGLFKAIKFVYGNLNSLDVDGARAEQELHALNRVKEVRHPFVLSMDRIEVVGGELVIVMELADRNLHEAYEECLAAGLVGIPRDTLLCYIRDAAEALDHMNERHNLQHLDVKPRNLFLVSDRVKVADFGLVKHLERAGASGLLGGVTPLYASPETFSGAISGRSDQYSLAIVYQELLTGQRPFGGKNARQLCQQHLHEEPDLRSLPEGDRAVVARGLAKDPARRFPNCLAFVRALYTAPAPRREAALDPRGQRPRSMADTMENFILEQLPAGGDDAPEPEAVELRADPAAALDEEGRMGTTVAQPQTGSVRPTLVIGVGSFGRRALAELRCRFLDRFGAMDKLPLVRFLYVDTDPDAARAALRGPGDVAFTQEDVYHLSLQPVSHYRRGQLDQLNDWLPREKLYGLPRSLKTQGSRALGRLAFTDHYQRLRSRVKKDLAKVTHPDAIYQAVTQTGLALRDDTPRVYILASASGGGSGYLPDLGYLVRRLMREAGRPEAPVTALLYCGAPADPATPKSELANTYATLTEVNHFADPAVPFSAQYGTNGPRLADEGPAFDHTYLLTTAHRTPEARRDAVAHLSSFLFHELTTPLGLRLDRCRQSQPPAALPFRSFGTYSVWFPRGLLLRLAARGACHHVLQEWQGQEAPADRSELEAAYARLVSDPELHPDALVARVTAELTPALDGKPTEALTRLLASVEEQAQQFLAHEDPGGWASQALTRVQDWLGSGVRPAGESAVHQRKSRLTKALEAAAEKLAEEWDKRLMESAFRLMEQPGSRVAAAEAMVELLIQFFDDAARAHAEKLEALAGRTRQAREQLDTALENCLAGGGGFSWFGGRSRKLVRVFLDHLAAFARQCLAEDVSATVAHFYGLVRGRLAERTQELGFCRQRLRHMQEALESAAALPDEEPDPLRNGELTGTTTPVPTATTFWETIRASATTRVVLPAGEADLERAAERFLDTLTPDQWAQLDQALQDQVLSAQGGLHAALTRGDLLRHVLRPLQDQAASFLSGSLPITDVAQVEFLQGDDGAAAVQGRIREYYDNAAPLAHAAAGPAPEQNGSGTNGSGHPAPAGPQSFLLIPASDAGRQFGELAQKALPGLHLVNVPGQADLMFCREQGGLGGEDVERILKTCRPAYEEVANAPVASPHARFDIQDWSPLDP
jgi:hypothetical protein